MLAISLGNRRGPALVLFTAIVVAAGGGLLWTRSSSSRAVLPRGGAPSILVIPLSVSGDDTDPWSGAGLAEEIRTALAADTAVVIRRARAEIVRTSAPATGGSEDISRIAAEARRVGADYVLTGTVSRKSSKSEIGLRLVRATDEKIAWSGTFWRSRTDLPTFAMDLAAAVTEAISAERNSLARHRKPGS